MYADDRADRLSELFTQSVGCTACHRIILMPEPRNYRGGDPILCKAIIRHGDRADMSARIEKTNDQVVSNSLSGKADLGASTPLGQQCGFHITILSPARPTG